MSRWLGLQFALFVAGAGAISSSSQSPAPIARDLAQRVDRHYDQIHSLKATFTESYAGLGMERTESGTLLLQKPGRMTWNYDQPAGKVFVLDGKYAWFYTRGAPQVQRMTAKELDDLRSPLRFLLGHTQLEKELTGLTETGTAQGDFTLTGVPKGQEERVKKLSLTVTAAGVITAIEVEERDGAMTHFTFSNEQTNVPIPPSTFRFTPPPDVPVVDTAPPASGPDAGSQLEVQFSIPKRLRTWTLNASNGA